MNVEPMGWRELGRGCVLDADPFETAEEFSVPRVRDRVEEQAVVRVQDGCVDPDIDPVAVVAVKVDGRASTTTSASDNCTCRLMSQLLDMLELGGQKRVEHVSLSPSQRPGRHAVMIAR